MIAGCLVSAALLIRSESPGAWLLAATLALTTLLRYVVSRTVGLPGDAGDIGDWLEPLGLASEFVEACTVLVVMWALVQGPRTA